MTSHSEKCALCGVAARPDCNGGLIHIPGADRWGRDEGCPQLAAKARQTKYFSAAPRYEDARLERAIPEHLAVINHLEACRHPNGLGGCAILLLGEAGAGKSYIAYGAVNLVRSWGMEAQFAPAVEILEQIRDTYSDNNDGCESEVLDACRDCALLVVDDFLKQAQTDWAMEKFYRIVDHRYKHLLPTIFTSNATVEEFGRGETAFAIISRLLDSGLVMEFKGTRRKGPTIQAVKVTP